MPARRLIILTLAALLTASTVASAQQGAMITPNYKDADLGQIVEAVSQVTGKNFIIDPRVRAQVTMLSSTPMNAAAFYEAFLAILQVHGFVAVPAGSVIKILPDAFAHDSDRVARFTREAQFAGLAAGQVQHVGDEVGKVLGAGVDAGEIAAVVFRQCNAPFLFFPLHHFDGTHDQAERGAQFVAHRGEEAAFEAAGVLGLLPGAADLLAQKEAGQRRADLLAQDLGEACPAGIHSQQHEAELAILKVERQRH